MVPVVLLILAVFQVPDPEILILREISSPEPPQNHLHSRPDQPLSGKFPGKVPGNVLEISRKCSGDFPETYGKLPGDVPEMFRRFSGNLLAISRKFPGDVPEKIPEMFRKFPGSFLEISRKFPGNVLKISRKNSGGFPEIS